MKVSPERDSVYKVGRTSDLNKRLATYKTGTIDGVDVVYKFRTDSHKAVEGCVKYKEVYEVNIDMIKNLISKCDEFNNWKKEYSQRKPSKLEGGYYYMALIPDATS